MPVNITDQDEFTSPIQAPDDGDPANGSTFQIAPQGLANRTRHLLNLLQSGEWDYASPEPFQLRVPISSFTTLSDTSGKLYFDANKHLNIDENKWTVTAPLNALLPPAAVVTEVNFVVWPGASSAGTDRMRVEFWTSDGPAIDGEYAESGNTSPHTIVVNVLRNIDRSAHDYELRVTSSNAATNSADRLIAVFVKGVVNGRRIV